MKKLLVLLLACLMLTVIATAEGIGSPGAPVKVTYLSKDVMPADVDTAAAIQAVEEAMAKQGKYVDIEALEAPTGKYIEVVPLAFRTGEINPDLIYFQGNTDLPVVDEGLLENLSDYLAKSEHLSKLLGEHSKNRMENHPFLVWAAPASVSVPAIRKDVFAKATTGEALLADPTIDNYYAFFSELKSAGLAKYAVGEDGGTGRLDSYFNHAFGVNATIMKVGDKLVYSMVTDAEKAKLAFYAKLYKEGLLDPDYITKTWDTMEQSFYEGETALITGRAGDVVQVYNTKVLSMYGPEGELKALPPAKGVGQAFRSIDVTKEERGFGINAESPQEVKDAAFAILDFMASPEGRKIDLLGAEGTHYTVENDLITFLPQKDAYWARFFPTTKGLPEGLKLSKPVMSEPGVESLALAQQFYAQDLNVALTDELKPLYAAVRSVYTEYASDFVRGVRTFDDWDEYVQKFNSVGGDQLSEYFATVIK